MEKWDHEKKISIEVPIYMISLEIQESFEIEIKIGDEHHCWSDRINCPFEWFELNTYGVVLEKPFVIDWCYSYVIIVLNVFFVQILCKEN